MKFITLLLLVSATSFAGVSVSNEPNNASYLGITSGRAVDQFVITKATTVSAIRFWWGLSGGASTGFSGTLSVNITRDLGGPSGTFMGGGTFTGVTSTPTGVHRGSCGGLASCPIFFSEFNLHFPAYLDPGTYWIEIHEGDSFLAGDATPIGWITSSSPGNARICNQCFNTPAENAGVKLAFQLFDTRVPEPGSIPLGADWKYLVTSVDQGAAWRTGAFNDAAWSTGLTRIGYGDTQKTTIGFGPDSNNKFTTTYFRKIFNVPDPAQIGSALLSLIKDDGAVVYLNGTEIVRSNMPAGAINYSTLAVNALSGTDETAATTFPVNPSLLTAGTNVIAVEVHQGTPDSSDLGFDLKLSLGQCPTTLSPTSLNFGSGATNATVSVTANAACRWRGTRTVPWLSVLRADNPFTADGQGNGTLRVTVMPNTEPWPRTASINVNGTLVQVLQDGTNVPAFYFDVPSSHIFFGHATQMSHFGVYNGCVPSQYCVDQITTRGKMAELVIRAKFGDNFPFNPVALFADVPVTHPQFKYIQKMKELGITAGCSATEYCPELQVTRGQIAVFLVRGKFDVALESEFAFNPAPYFTDVPANHVFFPYIQKLKDQGFTTGCSFTTYCPDGPNTLGQISVFLVRAFFAP